MIKWDQICGEVRQWVLLSWRKLQIYCALMDDVIFLSLVFFGPKPPKHLT